tara:strand:- start:11540 stop:12283 length:744 start_codon:yes stop_codon:yes gene_type:complete
MKNIFMKQIWLWIAILIMAPLSCGKLFAGERQWRTLFNGRNLSGWHAMPAATAGDWSVKHGMIVGHGSVNRLSYLVLNADDLADFELSLRYRLHGKGNSGIEIRAIPDPSGRRPLVGYHADLGHVGIGPHILGAWDFHFADRAEPPCQRGTRLTIDTDETLELEKIANPIPLSAIHHDDWNHVRIVAQGNRCAFYLNGKISSAFCDRAAGSTFQKGSIGLQIHDAGTRIEFKDIRMRLIQAAKNPGN